MKKIIMTMSVLVAMIVLVIFSSTKITFAAVEILRSDSTVEFNGNVDMFEEDKDSEVIKVNFKQEEYCIFYKIVKTGIAPEKMEEIDVMAATLDSGEVMNVLSPSEYQIRSNGNVVFPIGITIDMDPREFYRGPYKVFIKLKK